MESYFTKNDNLITENFSDDVGCLLEKKAVRNMRETHVMSQTKILLLQYKYHYRYCLKFYPLTTDRARNCALDQQPYAEMLAKGHIKNALKVIMM